MNIISNPEIVISSTGRCGSVYVAKLLTSVGILCDHESYFGPTGKEIENSFVSKREGLHKFPKRIAESSMFSAPFLKTLDSKTKIIHLVRHPLKVITSFTKDLNMFNQNWRDNKSFVVTESFIRKHIDIENIKDQLTAGCAYYVLWNRLIEEKFNFRFKKENDVKELFDYLEIKPDKFYQDKKCNSYEKNHNDKAKIITWEEIPDSFYKKELKIMAKNYGYIE